jgi:hypothetical protein
VCCACAEVTKNIIFFQWVQNLGIPWYKKGRVAECSLQWQCVSAYAQRTGAAARESLRRNCPVWFTPPAFDSVIVAKISKVPASAASTLCFLQMLSCVCMRSKAWLAACVSLQLARMPRPAQERRSRRLRATLAAAPVLFVHAFGPCYMEKTYGTSP